MITKELKEKLPNGWEIYSERDGVYKVGPSDFNTKGPMFCGSAEWVLKSVNAWMKVGAL